MKQMFAGLLAFTSVLLTGCGLEASGKAGRSAGPAGVKSPITALGAVAVPNDGLKLESMDGDVDLRQDAAGFVISDSDSTAHRSAKWLFVGARPATVYRATIAVRMVDPVAVGRLLRVSEIAGGVERAADCSFAEVQGEVTSRGDGLVGQPSLRNEAGKITVSCAVRTSAGPERLIVYLLPAVGANSTSYSEEGVGSLRVESLDIREDGDQAPGVTPPAKSATGAGQ